jgi:hypothetical protein
MPLRATAILAAPVIALALAPAPAEASPAPVVESASVSAACDEDWHAPCPVARGEGGEH